MVKRFYISILLAFVMALAITTQATAQSKEQQQGSTQQSTSQQQMPGKSNQSGQNGQAAGSNAGATTQGQKPQGQKMSARKQSNPFIRVQKSSQILTSSIVGLTIQNSAGKKAKQIGTVNDLIMNNQHQLVGVVVGVGGFLGIGQKNVGIALDAIKNIDVKKGVAIVSVTKKQLQNAPSFTTKEQQQQQQKSHSKGSGSSSAGNG